MSQMGGDGADHAAEYLGAVRGAWPLALIAGAVAMASAARQIRRGYKQRSRRDRAATVLLNAALTTSMAVSCALLLPLAVPEVTPEMQVAVSMAVSGLGGEAVVSEETRPVGGGPHEPRRHQRHTPDHAAGNAEKACGALSLPRG